MPAFDDDDDRDLAGSQDGSSDNELDDTMRDVDDGDADGDADGDGDGEADGDGEGDGDNDADPDSPSNSSQASDGYNASGPTRHKEAHQASPPPRGTSFSDGPVLANVRPEMLSAPNYDIVPSIAAPQSTSINTVTATADMRWVFSGGSDGYIRKYNWVETVNGKLMLTVAQRHPFVDSVVKAGVLMAYWENWDVPLRSSNSHGPEEANVLSPVYSLAVQNQGLWLLAGLESGNIRLQSIRHDEGKGIALLQKHTSAVSVLTLASDEKSLLSGSWDKNVLDWDLNVGKVRTTFGSSAGQISAIESRPVSSIPVPEESGELPVSSLTYSSNNHVNGVGGSTMVNGIASSEHSRPPADEAVSAASPDSLFGDADDDLFGDSGGAVSANGAPLPDAFAEDDDEFSRAIAHGPRPEDEGDMSMTDAPEALQPVQPPDSARLESVISSDAQQLTNGATDKFIQPLANGLPHAEDAEVSSQPQDNAATTETPPTSDSTFLATSIDGTIRIWDRRQPNPIARILPRNTPPWCMSACWSPDGNCVYAGRRNCTVEEYDLRKGLKGPERIFKFPQGSGPVTSVRAMPNGRHLICASYDILRLYDLKEQQATRSAVPFLIVPGHRTGVVSQLYMDPACRFMISTGGNRGWEGASTEVLLGYEIGVGA